MAETLMVSGLVKDESGKVIEAHIVDQSGDRIASLFELADAERFTALENRIAALENTVAELTAEPPEPEDPNAPSPPGGALKIHVQPEDTPTGQPVATPPDVSSPGSPLGVDGVPAS